MKQTNYRFWNDLNDPKETFLDRHPTLDLLYTIAVPVTVFSVGTGLSVAIAWLIYNLAQI